MFEEGHSLCSRNDIRCVRRRTFLVFEEGHSLCSKKDIPCVRRRRDPNFWSYRPQEGVYLKQNPMQKLILTSKNAKLLQNQPKITKKPKFVRKQIPKKIFDVEKSKVTNRPKRVFPKFRGDRSQVRGANARSKFEFLWSNTNFYGRYLYFHPLLPAIALTNHCGPPVQN